MAGRYKISLENAGIGPLIIKSIKIVGDGPNVKDITKLGFKSIDAVPSDLVCTSISDMENHAIRSGESWQLFQCDSAEQEEKIDDIGTLFHDIIIKVKYEDIYGIEQPEITQDFEGGNKSNGKVNLHRWLEDQIMLEDLKIN